jgi:hypothetical protein
MMLLLALFVAGWVVAALLGTQAYFMGEQSKPIHSRNWRSPEFHALAEVLTGQQVDDAERAISYKQDRYQTWLV